MGKYSIQPRMQSKTILKLLGLATVIAIAITAIALTISYANHDQETSELTDAVDVIDPLTDEVDRADAEPAQRT